MQVSFSIWFQELFSNFQALFDVFFAICSFFGEELFFIMIFVLCYYILDKELAKKFAITSIVAVGTCLTLKQICKIERPIEDPNVRFVLLDNYFVNTKNLIGTYSFPSGHAMLSSALFTSVGLNIKSKRFWIVSVFLVLLISASRIYLGVHFVIDCIVGIILGISIAYLMYRLYDKIRDKEYIIYLALIAFASLLLIFAENIDDYKIIAAVYGYSVGMILEKKFVAFDAKEGTKVKKILRIIIGLVVIIGLKEGFKVLFNLIDEESVILHMIRYFIIGIVAIFVYPLIFKKVKL